MPNGDILFWNVQHLAESSQDKKTQRIEATLLSGGADMNLLCEVMQSYQTFGVSAHTYGGVTGHTLCYAATDAGLRDLDVEARDDLTVSVAFSSQVKGGSKPKAHLNRKLVEVLHGKANWPRVFMIHANASKGAQCTTICAMWLEANVMGEWILVGDFNDEPQTVQSWLTHFACGATVAPPDDWTHGGSKRNTKLDYAIHSGGLTVTTRVIRRTQSDHRPIKVSWTS